MGSLVRAAAALLAALLAAPLALGSGLASAAGRDLRERDALCDEDGCLVVHFKRKTFLDSWRSCKDHGGNLATIKRSGQAAAIAALFFGLELRHPRTEVQVWIGLQRQPRQCAAARPLRGFSWTTGDQDTEYTNWLREDSPSLCLTPRCVAMSYSARGHSEDFKWRSGSCSVPVDGYICHYAYKAMCPPLRAEGPERPLYATPFNLLSTLLTHVPLGSVATVPCPAGSRQEQTVLCVQREDGSVGWSRPAPLCSDAPQHWCDQNNGGCEHFCRPVEGSFYCHCAEGFGLGADGQSCVPSDACQGAHCEFECLPLSDGHRCACPDGYMLAPDERGCLDVDECLQSPCEHICENGLGTFQCRCWEGYQPDGEGACEDLDECVNDPCEHACENTPGSHVCHCHLGYSPVPEDLGRCQDVDECQILGTCEQMCLNYEGGFECYCEEGFELMPDHFSCRRRADDVPPAATPSLLWVTHQPGPVWIPGDYDWPGQSHAGWPTEEEQALDWLTDPPTVLNSDVIWVTRAAQEDLPSDGRLDSTPAGPGRVQGEEHEVGWSEWRQSSQPETKDFQTATDPTPPTSTPPSTADWYNQEEEEEEEEEEEGTTTAGPFVSTSTISEGAWNWWEELSTSRQGDSVTGLSVSTDSRPSSGHDEEQPLPGENLSEDKEEEVVEEVTRPTASAFPTEPAASRPAPSVDVVDSVQEDVGRSRSATWLLVGVPVCVVVAVLVALGIACRAARPRHGGGADCYRWMSGAPASLSAGGKTHV